MQVYKAHGLGNDYLVYERGDALYTQAVRALCDRHHGVGGDGILEPVETDAADHGVRIWNPDGSIAEKSGNGLRIFAWWLHRCRGAPQTFTVHTGFDTVRCFVGPEQITIEMGHARFSADSVPVARALLEAPLAVGDDQVPVTAVGVGNPHCVVFTDAPDLDALPWRRWGAGLEVHPVFPNRTNVQLARVIRPGGLEMRVWERGAGPTLASGSSACAVAAAAVRTGRVEAGLVEVRMPGGVLRVTVGDDWALTLEGPVAPVGRVELSEAWRPVVS